MARRMAGQRKLAEPIRDLPAARRPKAFAISLDEPVGGIEIGRRRSRAAIAETLVGPEFQFVLMDDNFGPRERRLAFRVQKPARMVGVDVGHENGVEILRREASGAKVLR